MSKVIDERVVEMRFDNKDFESNVQTSLKTIDKLKDSLNFDDATRSVGKFQDSLKHFSLDDIGRAVESLSDKFNWRNVFKMDLLNNVTSEIFSVITGTFDRIKGELHLEDVDPVSNMLLGWQKYADKTQAVATIMASTGESMEYVNEQMNKLLYFSDETSYSFTDMANNIGKFTASGVELEEASTAMQGIATWAARSGQNAQTATHVMYNLAQAIGMGALKITDWRSVEIANMGTKEFREMAIAAGLVTGTLEKNAEGMTVIADGTKDTAKETVVTFQNFRDTLKDGWLDTDTLMHTLNEYGKAAELISEINKETGLYASEIIELAKATKDGDMSLKDFAKALDMEDLLKTDKQYLIDLQQQFKLLASDQYEFSLATYEAAQEARTFGDAMASVADAVSSRWMTTFELLFGGYETAKTLWTDLAVNLAEIFSKAGDERNAIFEEANLSGWDHFVAKLEEADIHLLDLESSMREIVGSDRLATIVERAGSFEEAIKQGKFSVDELSQAIDSLPGSFQRVKEISGEVIDNYEEMTAWSWELRKGMYDYVGHDDQVEKLMKAKNITKEYAEQVVSLSEKHEQLGRELTREEAAEYLTYTQLTDRLKETVDLTDEERDAIKATLAELDKKGAQEAFVNGLMNIGAIALNTFTTVREAIKGMFPPMTAKALRDLANGFDKVTSDILKFITKTNTVRNIVTALIFPFRVLADVIGALIHLVSPLGRFILAAFAPLIGVISQFGEWIIRIRTATGELNPFADVIDKVAEALSVLFGFAAQVIQLVYSAIRSKLVQKFTTPFQNLITTLNSFKDNKLKSLDDFIKSIKKADATKVANIIVDGLRGVYHAVQRFLSPVINFFNKISSAIRVFVDDFTNRFKALSIVGKDLSFLNRAFTALRGTLSYFGINIDPVLASIDGFLSNIGNKLNKIRSTVHVFTTDFANRFKALGTVDEDMNILERAFTALRGTLSYFGIDIEGVIQKIQTAKQAIVDFFVGTRTGAEESKKNFSSFVDNIRASIPKISKTISDGTAHLSEFIKGLGITLPKVLAGGGIVAAGAGLLRFIRGLKETKESGGKNVIENLKDAIFPLSDTLETLKTTLSGFNIRAFAISMTLLAGALIALSFVPSDKLAASLGVLGGALAGFIATIASVNKIVGDSGVDKGVLKLVGMGFAMIAIASSLLIFAKAVEKLNNIKFNSGAALLKVIALMTLAVKSMGALAKAAGKSNFRLSGGLGLIAIAGALWAFGKALESYNNLNINEDNVGKVLGTLVVAVGAMSFVARTAGKNNFRLSNGLGLIAMAGSLYLFANLVTKLGNIPDEALKKGLMALAALGLIVSVMTELMGLAAQDLKFSSALGTFVILAGMIPAIVVFGLAVAGLGSLDQNTWMSGLFILFSILGMMALMLKAIQHINKDVGIGKAIAVLIEMTTIVLTVAAFGAVCAILGVLSPVISLGLLMLAAILAEIGWVVSILQTLIKAGSMKKVLAGVAAIGLFGLALIPMVYALTELGKLDFDKTQKNMILLGELLLAFAGVVGVAVIVGALAKVAGPILLVGVGVIAGVFALFVGAITVLVKDLERLADIDAESAKAGLDLVKEELNILTDLAREFQENEGLFTASLGAALVCLAFGKGLHELATDTQILGLANAEQASESLKVVQEEIDLMMELGEELAANQGSFGRGILASATAFNFGIGLNGLANDTRILGLVNAENAQAALEPLKGLISTMIALAESIGTDPTLFGKALVTSADLIAFGVGLLPLVGAEFLTGLADATTVKANMEQIGQMIDKLFEIATKISADASLYFSAKAAAEAIKDFGHALVPIVGTEFLAQFVDGEASKSGLEPAKQMVDWLFEVAQKFDGQESLAKNAETAVKSMKGFAVALGGLTLGNFFSQFVSGERSLEGLEPAKQAIDMLIQLVQAFTTTEGAAAAAETAVESVKSFADGLTSIFWSLSTGGWDAIDPTNILSVIDAVIQGIMELSTINGQISNVSAALSGIGSLFDSLEALSGKGGLFGGKKLDASGIIEAFDSVGTALVNLGTKADLEQVGTKIVNSIVTPITNEITTAANAVSTMAQTMSDTIASFEKAFNVDGNNIAVGFINGINSRVQDAYDAGYNLASEAERGTRDAGEIQSPSKVFKDLGGFIGTGFVEGIQSKYGQVSDVAQEMAMRAYAIVQAITERMNALLAEKSNELRITPVVDMSGVDQLSSLMSNAQGSHNLGNYQINSEIIDKTIQNKNVVSEIKTLHDHLQSLAEHMDNMQIVMDTGALVGATSAKMDGQFGIMSMRRGRGN